MKALFKSLWEGWKKTAHFIGRVNTAILLTLFYFLFLGITKGFMVLSGKDLLDEKWKDRTSYWRRREGFKVDREAFRKPY